MIVRTALQDVPGPGRHSHREEEAAEDQDDLHLSPVQGAGESLPGDSLPRHLHQGGDRHEDRPHGGQSPGEPGEVGAV